MSNSFSHYGTPRHSGRYPWGSGGDPEQRNKSFIGHVEELKKKGLSEVDIARGMGITTSQLRAKKSIAKAEQRKSDVAQAMRLKDKGYSNVAIGERMGINESSVRALLNPSIQERSEITNTTANMLKDAVEKKNYIDVGLGVEKHIGISRTKLNTAVSLLEEQGYRIHKFDIEQVGTSKKTNMKVLTKDNVDYGEMMKNKDKIRMITDYSEDGGRSFLGLEPIRSVDSKRVLIKYAEDGGKDKDGVIELRRGVDDISLGNARYAQVRIGVDGTHYMKGMAIYNDDMPKGVDIIYNTNKTKDVPKDKVFKEMKSDPDNPFGSTVRQSHYIDKDGKKQLSALNIMGSKEGAGEEGAWGEWSKSISSQVLSKQPPALAKKQLGLAYDVKKEEFDEIMSLTNPVVKRKLLESFSDDCDSAAVHLKAAALPRQASHVLLPIPSLKETEVYAPNYRDGERVVLIRHPHGGIFEIPELTVNNRNKMAKSILEDSKDAIGIHPKVAEQLSGADFDGDTAIVIPNNHHDIKTSAPLKGLKDFDPKISYAPYDGMRTMDGGTYNAETRKVDFKEGQKPSSRTKGIQMGMISNLITDMTIQAANNDEIARAVRHSMVVIDAEKHHLDYKRSAIENNIAELKDRYQNGGGSTTLISRASSELRVPHRENGAKVEDPKTGKQKRLYIDPKTGKKLYNYTNESYTDRNGKIIQRTVSSTKMAETDDAFTLSSGTPMEAIYATHANKLKSLANQARKEMINTGKIYQSSEAKKKYAKEVATLTANLSLALKNKPLERQAQLLANSIVSMKKAANTDMSAAEVKKIKGQALAEARSRTLAKKQNIPISDREWEAIQAGAVSTNTLTQILNNTDMDRVKQLATPREKKALSSSLVKSIKLRLEKGYTQAEIADALGISTNTINKLID